MLIGSIGVAIMFLDVMPEMRIGYGYLILGLLSASTSLVIARLIGKFESNPMALIFLAQPVDDTWGSGLYLGSKPVFYHTVV